MEYTGDNVLLITMAYKVDTTEVKSKTRTLLCDKH